MKKTKLMTKAVLIFLMVFGVLSVFVSGGDQQGEYEAAIALAEDYMTHDAYQLAIAEYEKAIIIKDSEMLRAAVLNAYEKRYQESRKVLTSYIASAESAVSAFPQNEEFYTILTKVYIRNDNYQLAYKKLKAAIDSGVNSENMLQLYAEVKYAFDTGWYSYSDIQPCVLGEYPVKNSDLWGYVDETGQGTVNTQYSFVSQPGENGIRIVIGDQKLLIDGDGVTQGKLDFVPLQAGTYSEGFIAIHNGNSFGYYNSLGDYQFGEYEKASDFQNGQAVVCFANGKWSVIGSDGNIIRDTNFEDIVIAPDGSYCVNKVILAKENGRYRLYNEDFEVIGNFTCENVDILTETGIFAFEKDGKWGYADCSGEVLIEAQFESAKSFSAGLGAVCQDGEWGFIDENGEVVIDYQFFGADYFNSEHNCFVKTTSATWQMIQLKVDF